MCMIMLEKRGEKLMLEVYSYFVLMDRWESKHEILCDKIGTGIVYMVTFGPVKYLDIDYGLRVLPFWASELILFFTLITLFINPFILLPTFVAKD